MSSNDNTIPTIHNESKIKDCAENILLDSNQISSDEQLSQGIDSINFSTTFQGTNTYESEAKLSTSIPRTYAQVVRGAELVKRSEKLGISTINSLFSPENPKENKQTNETQEIPPIVGKIYKLTYSLHELFDIHDAKSLTGASSSKSPLPKKPKKANERPCLVIRKTSESANVLLITRFNYLDPTSEEVLPQLPKENLLKYILSIHPASPIYGRRRVKITSPQCPGYFDPSEKSYVVLKPITVSLKPQWPAPLTDYIDNDELVYIRDVLFNIFMEERDQSMVKSEIIRNNFEDNDNEDDNTTSTSSFSTPRFLQELFGRIDSSLNKSKEIEKWLADVEPSPEFIIDLNN